MAARFLKALPWYCRKCGRRHDASDRIDWCKNKLCRERDFTLSISDVTWDLALTLFDRKFLRDLEIPYD